MAKVFEKMVDFISEVFLTNHVHEKQEKKEKEKYTLSSVFPSIQIMEEVEKYL